MGSQENELQNGSDVVIVYGNAVRLWGWESVNHARHLN